MSVDAPQGYHELSPPEPLRGVVACFWVRSSASPAEVRVLPDGCADVLWSRGEGVFVVGPDTSSKLVQRGEEDMIVGVRFEPGAGGGVLGVPLDQLRDRTVEAAEIDRRLALDPDLAPGEVLTRFAAAVAGRGTDLLIQEAARRVGEQDLGSIASDLGISERQLRRRFHAAVGYGPQTLARVRRFRRVIDAIDGGRTDLADVAIDAGYADQAHMTRETKRLSGLTPSELRRGR
jgi:AraC-like DNA-binding protein